MLNSFKELTVWQKSMLLCEEVYRVTKGFPTSELYSLTSQIRRCAVSIPSNIAEGYQRGHRAEYRQFLRVAYGSAAELDTQLLLSLKIGYLKQEEYQKLNLLLEEILKMLNKLLNVLVSQS